MSERVKPKAVVFDLYGTLIDIRTDEHRPEVWTAMASFLRSKNLPADAEVLSSHFHTRVRSSIEESEQEYPEVDIVGVFRTMLQDLGYPTPDSFDVEAAQRFRALSRLRLSPFPDTKSTLQALRASSFKLGIVSDAQEVFLKLEMKKTGLTDLIEENKIIVSSTYGYRKPDLQLFQKALDKLGVLAEQAVYVGDSIFRDVCGARKAGLQAVLLKRSGEIEEEEDFCKPDMIIRTLDELCLWLLV